MEELLPDEKTLFADVILPIPVDQYFTYRVPRNLKDEVAPGKRVIVPLGNRKVVTGVVANVSQEVPAIEARYLLDLLDEIPSLTTLQLGLLNWIASYYCCTPGEVLQAMLPAALKLSSESMVRLRDGFVLDLSDEFYSDKELIILNALANGPISYTEIAKITGTSSPFALIKSLTSKDCIQVFEEVQDPYKPPIEKCIRLQTIQLSNLHSLFDQLAGKQKQEELLLRYLQVVPVMNQPELNETGIPKRVLMAGNLSTSALQTMIKGGIFEAFNRMVNRFEEIPLDSEPVRLNEAQQTGLNQIHAFFQEEKVTLLHGVTGSGKTEIFIRLIQQALEAGNQVLYLLPEIALTTQIVQRLRKNFGKSMGVYHSRFSDNERVDIWKGIISGELRFVVGVRSSILLPFDNLGLIIVDEEHDASYKQQEPAPRYHARDVAIMLGRMHQAKVLLGSATPSVETYSLATSGKFGYVQLLQRFGKATMPEVVIANMKLERVQKTNKGELSGTLLQAMETMLTNGDQGIIFQNRRGYSPLIQCESCSWVPTCIHCDVSLTYHQFKNGLVCHYCGYREPLPERCPVCKSTALKTLGWGTEKLEEELKLLFPEVGIDRMDLDTTRTKRSYEGILEHFEKGKTRILVGTQMVTKGLDFDRVSLVGIINADRILHFPDFRAYERAYQLILQVSGRAGRREQPGKVVIQTSRPDHPILELIKDSKHELFYQQQLEERFAFHYPPYARLIEITLKHVERKVVHAMAEELAELLRKEFAGLKVLGPAEPMVARIRNKYLETILVKIPRATAQLPMYKQRLNQLIQELMKSNPAYRSGKIITDVDPV